MWSVSLSELSFKIVKKPYFLNCMVTMKGFGVGTSLWDGYGYYQDFAACILKLCSYIDHVHNTVFNHLLPIGQGLRCLLLSVENFCRIYRCCQSGGRDITPFPNDKF